LWTALSLPVNLAPSLTNAIHSNITTLRNPK